MNKQLEKATGEHFNQPGHQMSDMKITILEKLKLDDSFMRKTSESYFIKKFISKYKGMNKKS